MVNARPDRKTGTQVRHNMDDETAGVQQPGTVTGTRQPLRPGNRAEDVVQRAGTRGRTPNGQNVRRGVAAMESDSERRTTAPTNGRANRCTERRASSALQERARLRRSRREGTAGTSAEPVLLLLRYRGLELCDGCGTILALRERLAGLCARAGGRCHSCGREL